MKIRILLLFDCPEKENDKQWLLDELRKIERYNVEPLYPKYVLSRLFTSGKTAKKAIAIHEIIKSLTRCRKEIIEHKEYKHIVICWSIMKGMLSEFIIPRNAYILSLNWLTPDGRFINTHIGSYLMILILHLSGLIFIISMEKSISQRSLFHRVVE